jgi:hypothetical protein
VQAVIQYIVSLILVVMQVAVPLLPAIAGVDFALRKSDLIKQRCEQRFQRKNCCLASCQLRKSIRAVDDSQKDKKQRSIEEIRIPTTLLVKSVSSLAEATSSEAPIGCAQLFRAHTEHCGNAVWRPPLI